MSDKTRPPEESTPDRLREVMVRDRTQMQRELGRPEAELEREREEAARRAYAGELDGGERPARTAREVFADPDAIKSLDNDLENQIQVEQEQAEKP